MQGMGPVLGSCLVKRLSSAFSSDTDLRYSSSSMGTSVCITCSPHESFLLRWSNNLARVPCAAPHAVHVVVRTLRASGGTTPCCLILWTISPLVALKRRGHNGHGMLYSSSGPAMAAAMSSPPSSTAPGSCSASCWARLAWGSAPVTLAACTV
eukprot:5423758-Amphidinium_carterae.2